MKKKFITIVAAAQFFVCSATIAAASDADVKTVLAPFQIVTALVCGIVSAIGVVWSAKEIMEFAISFRQSDSSGMAGAAKGIAGGFLMAGIGAILTLFGLSV